MSLSILTNISAMNTQQNLLKSSNAVSHVDGSPFFGPAHQQRRR